MNKALKKILRPFGLAAIGAGISSCSIHVGTIPTTEAEHIYRHSYSPVFTPWIFNRYATGPYCHERGPHHHHFRRDGYSRDFSNRYHGYHGDRYPRHFWDPDRNRFHPASFIQIHTRSGSYGTLVIDPVQPKQK